MSRERGQASVELVAIAAVLAAVGVAIHGGLLWWSAQERAQRIADQAAVLVAEGRPPPAALRREARIRVSGRVLLVTVPVSPLPGLGRQDAVARAVLP